MPEYNKYARKKEVCLLWKEKEKKKNEKMRERERKLCGRKRRKERGGN